MRYEVYELSKKEWLLYGAEGILGAAVLDYVFYRSIGLFLILMPMGLLFPLLLKKELKKRRLEMLRGQFKDAILAVASGLKRRIFGGKCVCGEFKGNGGDPWE